MRRVLVLGAGHVGTFAARAIAEAGAEVVAADLQPAPGYFARFGPQRGATLTTCDIHDPAAVATLINGHAADAVVLSAGPAAGGNAAPDTAWRIAVDGAAAVAQAALAAGVERLIVVSSFAVYGRPAVQRLAETMPLAPCTEYGRIKAAAEDALRPFRARGLEIRVLRACGIYGPLRPGHGSHAARLIESLLFFALTGRPCAIQAAPRASDEYLYAKDLGRAIAAVALNDTTSPEFVFNVGSGTTTTAAELCATVRQVAPASRVAIEPAPGNGRRPLPPLDVARIREVFRFQPRYDLAAGLADYLQETGLQP